MSLASRIQDAGCALVVMKEPIDKVVFSESLGLSDVVADWFTDYYDNSIELVLEPGKTPDDVGSKLDGPAREWGFRLIHFQGHPSALSRVVAP